MPFSETALDLTELCDATGVTPRTVRYYIQRGLLPSPDHAGPATRYGSGHLNRLRLIRKLQREHLPLAEIRRSLVELGDAEVEAMLDESAPAVATESAQDYIRAVLGTPDTGHEPRGDRATPARLATPVGEGATFPRERAQWERLTLGEGIELHVRRPLSREHNRQVVKLLEAARRILADDRR